MVPALLLLVEPRTDPDEDQEELGGRAAPAVRGRVPELVEEAVEMALDMHVVLVDDLSELALGGGCGEKHLDQDDHGVGHAHEVEDGQAADGGHVEGQEHVKDAVDGLETGGQRVDVGGRQRGIRAEQRVGGRVQPAVVGVVAVGGDLVHVQAEDVEAHLEGR